MNERLPHITLLVLLLVWLAIAAPGLAERYAIWSDMRSRLGDRPLEERAALLDTPAVPVARALSEAVPPEGCITVLAYAGPAAIDYYSARLAYLLYPRSVSVSADSSASTDGCEFLAVFRDSRQNLAAEPFQGNWDEEELERLLQPMERVDIDGPVRIYRVP